MSDEQKLIDQIIEKNTQELFEETLKQASELPSVPKKKLTAEEEIEKILDKFIE
jgi:hypothetical protein